MEFILTTAPGLEELTLNELQSLGIKSTPEDSGAAVRFEGSWEDAAKVLTSSRFGSRLLISLKKFSSKNQRMLYDQVRRVEWAKLFSNFDHTFAVFTHGETEGLDFNLKFAALKIKDAICDEVKKFQGSRPNVHRNEPDLRIEAFFYAGRCELSIDLSGEPLHRRGYREESGEAPLRENRAAALLKFAGFDGTQKLVDPFCGSGTILVEAALMSQNKAPGLLKNPESFAGTRFIKELLPALQKVRTDAAKLVKSSPSQISGADINSLALKEARENLKRAGCSHLVSLDQRDALKLMIPGALIVCNPPYGERLQDAEDAAHLLSDFVRQVKHFCAPSTLVLVLPKGEMEKHVGLKPSESLTVENGNMTIKFLKFEIFAGKADSLPKKKLLVSGKSNLSAKKKRTR